jgi:hypothetical protein
MRKFGSVVGSYVTSSISGKSAVWDTRDAQVYTVQSLWPSYGSIATGNQLIYVDAGNVSSYSGTGTTWFDISGNSRNGTLTNGPVYYANVGGGSFFFNNVDPVQKVAFAYNLGTLSSYTIEIWANRSLDKIMFSANEADQSYLIEGGYRYYNNGTNTFFSFSTTPSIPLGTWGHWCITYGGGTFTAYRNAANAGTTTATGGTDFSVGVQLAKYAFAGSNLSYKGYIAIFRMYSRTLSAGEVLTNFNVERNRFGV